MVGVGVGPGSRHAPRDEQGDPVAIDRRATVGAGLFTVGITTAAAAVVRAFTAAEVGEALATAGIAGLSAASFFALFLARPLEALERNAIYSQWLSASVTAYWTRLAYLSDAGTVDAEIAAATVALTDDLDRLAARHAAEVGPAAVPVPAPEPPA